MNFAAINFVTIDQACEAAFGDDADGVRQRTDDAIEVAVHAIGDNIQRLIEHVQECGEQDEAIATAGVARAMIRHGVVGLLVPAGVLPEYANALAAQIDAAVLRYADKLVNGQ